VTDETPSRRKPTPGDASMRRSIQDLAFSMDPNIKIEPEVEDVRQLFCSILRPSRVHPLLAHIASFGYCRRVHRLGHQFWVSPCQASRRRHVRSEGLATSSRCVACPSSLSSVMAYMLPMQNAIIIFAFLVSHRTSHLSRFPKRAQRLPPRVHKARRRVPRARRTRFVRIASHRWHRPSERRS
jgi:hypothetical protein